MRLRWERLGEQERLAADGTAIPEKSLRDNLQRTEWRDRGRYFLRDISGRRLEASKCLQTKGCGWEQLEFFASTFYGFFFGFALGVGCSLAVLYAIYSGGYRKAMEDSLNEVKPERYQRALAAARRKLPAEARDGDG